MSENISLDQHVENIRDQKKFIEGLKNYQEVLYTSKETGTKVQSEFSIPDLEDEMEKQLYRCSERIRDIYGEIDWDSIEILGDNYLKDWKKHNSGDLEEETLRRYYNLDDDISFEDLASEYRDLKNGMKNLNRLLEDHKNNLGEYSQPMENVIDTSMKLTKEDPYPKSRNNSLLADSARTSFENFIDQLDELENLAWKIKTTAGLHPEIDVSMPEESLDLVLPEESKETILNEKIEELEQDYLEQKTYVEEIKTRMENMIESYDGFVYEDQELKDEFEQLENELRKVKSVYEETNQRIDQEFENEECGEDGSPDLPTENQARID